ncbi:MAG: ComF family protein [Bacteroidales bacterium]|nr:ComF family protein [Bacteroidales bacterium]
MNIVQKSLESLVSLLYPRNCYACNTSLVGNEIVLCTACRHSLPETGFYDSDDNPVMKLFWGRIPVVHATAFLFFEKSSKYQALIHQLKYNGKKEVGIFLGNLLGAALRNTKFNETEVIVSVPLHRSKLRRRGYNQSDIIAGQISEITGKPHLTNVLKRRVNTRSQTGKKRYDRWKNVEGIFECCKPELIKNKHVLLIDDVVTTGATLEAAGRSILEVEGTCLSVASTAYVN